jgi:hypothetical protein
LVDWLRGEWYEAASGNTHAERPHRHDGHVPFRTKVKASHVSARICVTSLQRSSSVMAEDVDYASRNDINSEGRRTRFCDSLTTPDNGCFDAPTFKPTGHRLIELDSHYRVGLLARKSCVRIRLSISDETGNARLTRNVLKPHAPGQSPVVSAPAFLGPASLRPAYAVRPTPTATAFQPLADRLVRSRIKCE